MMMKRWTALLTALVMLLGVPCAWAEEEDEAAVLGRPKQEKSCLNILPIPPLPFDLFPLETHETRLGAPTPLKPPSTSVYTTGNSLSPGRLPPENLPTANPPPGNLQIVRPTVSSGSGSGAARLDTSLGNSCRQTGQEFLMVVEDIVKNQGTTVVMITHNAEIAKMANRVVKLRGGRIASIRNNAHPLPAAEIIW